MHLASSVPCLSVDELVALVEGRLDGPALAQMKEHVAGCHEPLVDASVLSLLPRIDDDLAAKTRDDVSTVMVETADYRTPNAVHRLPNADADHQEWLPSAGSRY